MQIDNHLKETLLQLRPSFRETIPIYAIRQLKADEQEKNAHYLASKFMNRDIAESFRSSIKRSNNSTVVILPEGTKMRIYNNSNCMVIKKKMGPLENLITKKLDEEQLKDNCCRRDEKIRTRTVAIYF